MTSYWLLLLLFSITVVEHEQNPTQIVYRKREQDLFQYTFLKRYYHLYSAIYDKVRGRERIREKKEIHI